MPLKEFSALQLRRVGDIVGAMTPTRSCSQLIVDDWGMSPGINDATIDLARRGALFGVSMMPGSPYLAYRLEELRGFSQIKIGCHLHFTFLQPRGLRFFVMSVLSPRRREWIRSEIFRQFSDLKKHISHVDYLDGHQHVHLLPGILGAVLEQARAEQIPIRVVRDVSHWGSYVLGGFAELFLRKSERWHCGYIPDSFFENPERVRKKLWQSVGRALIVHPATSLEHHPAADGLKEGRLRQFQVLAQEFLDERI